MEIVQEKDENSPFVTSAADNRGADPIRGASVKVSVYENLIPDFVGPELERLYESVYSTLERLAIYDDLRNVSTYVETTGEATTAVLLFHYSNGIARVLNQQIELPAATIERFSETLFSRYRSLRQVFFYALASSVGKVSFPYQQYRALEEHVVTLPAAIDEYWASLRPAFRRNIRRADRGMREEYPSFRYQIQASGEATDAAVREIILLSVKRMAFKQQSAYIDEDEIKRLMPLIRARGYVGLATVDGRVCGGNVWYRVGRRCFMHLIAHDPEYNAHMLGNLVVYLGFCAAIKQGARECWLMGGGHANKTRFLAVPRYLDSVVVYRSRAWYLLDWRRVVWRAARQLMLEGRDAFVARLQGTGAAAWAAKACMAVWRSIKRRRSVASQRK